MILELMIINEAGIAIFYHNFIDEDTIDDEQSLASYFDIICRFTKNSFKESLRTIILDSFIFYFYTNKSRFHLVLKCDNRNFDKKLLESVSEMIIQKFINQYKEILEDFNGDISYFRPFSENLETILKSKFKDFIKIHPIEQ
jgi:hypothetical protein